MNVGMAAISIRQRRPGVGGDGAVRRGHESIKRSGAGRMAQLGQRRAKQPRREFERLVMGGAARPVIDHHEGERP